VIKFKLLPVNFSRRAMSDVVVERLIARGHPNIRATHRTTLEITKERHLTPRGDCIIAVGATKGLRDFSDEFKKLARRSDTEIILIIEVDRLRDVVRGFGDPRLTFDHPTDIVCRKSTYTCGRTLMVRCNKAAVDIDRRIVERMKDPSSVVEITIIARSLT